MNKNYKKVKNVLKILCGESLFSIDVVTSEGFVVVGDNVNFTIDDKTSTVQTDSNGISKIT